MDEVSLYTREELTTRRRIARRRIAKQRVYRQRRLAFCLLLAVLSLVSAGGIRALATAAPAALPLPKQHTPLVATPHRVSHSEEEALASIPSAMLYVYRRAGALTGASWQLLAAIGRNESDHGLSEEAGIHEGINSADCCSGPAQMCVVASCGETWQHYS